jgi:hypothetical protein
MKGKGKREICLEKKEELTGKGSCEKKEKRRTPHSKNGWSRCCPFRRLLKK